MIEEKSKIKKGPAKRNPASYQVTRDIVIPAGTILRWQSGSKFGCGVEGADFSIDDEKPELNRALFRKVTVA
jgi:hypothetical protein